MDKKNGNNLWVDYISKDTKDARPDFKKLLNGEIVPIGYQWVNFHMIFDFKMEYFKCKVRLVVKRHVTKPPSTITYAIIV